ncbi:trypsin-like peptidase domain-containing protein [Myxosarcina sp. GI1]|uniref:trypsin-like peptidase domain-containing protein n=1 Tax=Myxosarcina sp. GI1 TaxID=1541065 RepID=UPI0012E06904|nr:trypsin-like peptidase domain-containing protein [Myxosarcina sp. GI1]
MMKLDFKNLTVRLKKLIKQAILYSIAFTFAVGLLVIEPSTVAAEVIGDSSTIPTPVELNNFVTSVVKNVEPAVVQINVSRSLDGVFLPFFGRSPGNRTAPTLQGVGSGFVIDTDGLIVTNAHVVDRADKVTVSFQDGLLLDGRVLGKDPITDIAVIQVESPEFLPAVTIGDSDLVQQGEWAIAIGNPLGLQETVTVGVISATNRFSRDIGIPDKRIGFLQTDAAINPGNSGGPLLNANGEVIAVNSAIIGGAQGLGFAIPINTARRIARQIIDYGKVEHPYIGIEMVSLTPEIKQRFNQSFNRQLDITSDRGILIMTVSGNSPASKAGLQVGDIIKAVNQQTVTKAETLQRLLDENGIDRNLQLEIERQNESIDITVKPEPLPEAQGRSMAG